MRSNPCSPAVTVSFSASVIIPTQPMAMIARIWPL